jgi:hypothetical protein
MRGTPVLSSAAFQPFALSTQRLTVSDVVTKVTLPSYSSAITIWVDNRGSTDILVECGNDPSDTQSFPIASGCAQPITITNFDLRLKRVTGSAAELVIITPGIGF